MARIPTLPSLDIIRGFKGILDFYLWRGLPCVRAWPRWRPARQTDASLTAALLFGAIIKAFSLTHGAMLEQLAPETVGIPRTARDLYVSGVFGNLHEASMSDFLDLLTECRDFLSQLTAILNALDSIDTDELVVNVDESVLPPLAATTTNQALAIAALQKLDDLQDALESKALDRLIVRGEDQFFSFTDVHYQTIINLNAALGSNSLVTVSPSPGQLVIITAISAHNATSACTRISIGRLVAGTYYTYENIRPANPYDFATYSGWLPIQLGDQIFAWFDGCAAGDDLYLDIGGFRMTREP